MIKLTATQEITPYKWCVRARKIGSDAAFQYPGLLNHAREVRDRLFVDGRRRRGRGRLPFDRLRPVRDVRMRGAMGPSKRRPIEELNLRTY